MANRGPMKKEEMDELVRGLIAALEEVCRPGEELTEKQRKKDLEDYLKKLHVALHYRLLNELPRGWKWAA